MQQKINETISYLKSKISINPLVGIILGTGLNDLATEVDNKIEILYEDIPGFVRSTAPSHQGKLIAGTISDMPILMLQGRFHFYEGYTMEQVTYPIRVFKKLGIKYLFVTNAAGSLNPTMRPGNLVLLNDHINMMGTNPLIGKNLDEFGERFPSMNEPYDAELQSIARSFAETQFIDLQNGVYCAVTGPSLETKAECKLFASLGADLVGMSTVPEVIVAVHSGLKVLAISVVTNLSNIFHDQAHSQEEIRDNAKIASNNLINIIKHIINELKLKEN
ncbi:MAG TPA: purine-nucleoside phosphorylase [Candidatus Cloacimonadota bacterium]|jgi:purine-nucleoside phosphorylase|nr:purine-nucleoside phosphorylase [Candidatus Cloacimonadales bacterium]HPY97059.1 purine-nucleoside phosphorylase [Candidatus Cloacimonadota bacterium]HQB41615.1 purine-nucleoside phosphorylase [Candidatus Cloacimonadota bacterium]